MSAELQFKIYEDFLHYFLPEGLLDFFGLFDGIFHFSKPDTVFCHPVRNIKDDILPNCPTFFVEGLQFFVFVHCRTFI